MSLSSDLRLMVPLATHWVPGTGWRLDSIMALQLLMLAARAERLEAALLDAQQRASEAAEIRSYLERRRNFRPQRHCPARTPEAQYRGAAPQLEARIAAALLTYGD